MGGHWRGPPRRAPQQQDARARARARAFGERPNGMRPKLYIFYPRALSYLLLRIKTHSKTREAPPGGARASLLERGSSDAERIWGKI